MKKHILNLILALLSIPLLLNLTGAVPSRVTLAQAISPHITTAVLSAQLPVSPIIGSPEDRGLDGEPYIFGKPIAFSAFDEDNNCPSSAPVIWRFSYRRSDQDPWEIIPPYQFTAGRLLSTGGTDWLIPIPGQYRVVAEMCMAFSEAVWFKVDYDTPLVGEIHPKFADFEWIDWDDPENDNHVTTAHFNMFWNTQETPDDDTLDETLGFLECVWATLDHWMLSPLDEASIYRHYQRFDEDNGNLLEDYVPLTRVTVLAGYPGGGGHSQPQGLYYGPGVGTRNWVLAHELFHVFDYAGNPLHNKPWFDHRQQNNAYVFFHESTTGVAQTMGEDAFTVWGYRTDVWPYWAPLDLGLFELDYFARPFWAYLINNYGFEPRLTWEGPPTIDACQPNAQIGHPPHNFKLFEAWNAQVRQRVREEMGPEAALADYGSEAWCPEWHRNPDPNQMVLYNGEINPPCLQTLEYEMAVLEQMTAVRFPVAGTPLAESLLLDFAVKFAEEFPPASLLNGMPDVVPCNNLPGITFARGFEELPDDNEEDRERREACDEYDARPVVPDSLICDAATGANEHDFYARIKFNINEDRAKYLRIQANDDATVYVDGKAVIGYDDPRDPDEVDPDMNFPNASTTYADQSLDGWFIHAPVSSIFPVGDPLGRTFEIEWVNRGDGLGNADGVCRADRSRYLLMLEWYNPFSNTFGPITPDQIEVLSAEFWPGQGSGYPGFAPPPDHAGNYGPLDKEIQLRPVSEGERPFLLPSLGVNYHPVGCPVGYTGDLEVTVRDDRLTHTEPSVHLMVIRDAQTVEWRPGVVEEAGDEYTVSLYCSSGGDPATFGGDPAFVLVTTNRTLHCDPADDSCDPPVYACDPDNPGLCDPPVNPYGTMGAIHYTVTVAQAAPALRIHLPLIQKNWQSTGPTPTLTSTPTSGPTPTPTPTNTPTPTPTLTPTPTNTSTPTSTPTPTNTPTPTSTPAPTTVILTPIADAYISYAAPDTNYGAAPTLYVGKNETSIGRGLFQFDLSTIPAGSTVHSATFQAYLVASSTTPPSLDVELKQVDDPWTEPGVTWNIQPGTISIGKVNGVGTAMGYYDWDVAGLVQDWIDGTANHGLALWGYPENTFGWRGFASRESVSPPSPPRLVITYRP